MVAPGPLKLLPDIVSHLCSHPHYRLLTLRSIPQVKHLRTFQTFIPLLTTTSFHYFLALWQVPTISADFTTFTWPAMLKRMRQMLLTGEAAAAIRSRGSFISLLTGETAEAVDLDADR